MSKKVAVLKVYPMISAQIIENILSADIEGIENPSLYHPNPHKKLVLLKHMELVICPLIVLILLKLSLKDAFKEKSLLLLLNVEEVQSMQCTLLVKNLLNSVLFPVSI